MDNVYKEIERAFKKSRKPLTCQDLYETPEVRKNLTLDTTREVSDRLGYLYRQGLLIRQPHAEVGRHAPRWAYTWRQDIPRAPASMSIEDALGIARKYGGIQAREEGDVLYITTPKYEIAVRRKPRE